VDEVVFGYCFDGWYCLVVEFVEIFGCCGFVFECEVEFVV